MVAAGRQAVARIEPKQGGVSRRCRKKSAQLAGARERFEATFVELEALGLVK
jgi:hypothetical protein